MLGRDDPIGFNRWQRLALTGAGVLIGGGFLLSLAYGLAAGFHWGIILWPVFVALGAVAVDATLVWRLAEAAVRLLSRTVGEGAP